MISYSSPVLVLMLCLLTQALAFSPTQQQSSFSRSRPSSPPVCLKPHKYQIPFLRVTRLSEGVDTETQETQDEDQIREEEEEVDDDAKTYATNLELAKLASKCARKGRQSRLLSMTAYDLLQNMTYPDTVAYNSVLKAFAKSSPTKMPNVVNQDGTTGPWVTAAERAQALLEEMVQHQDAQAAASQDWYIRNAQGQLTEKELENGPPRIRVKPNVRSYSTVMDAWSRTGNVPATLDVLEALEERYAASGNDVALQPNIFSYNTVLSAFAKAKGDSAEQAQAFLRGMAATPDVISYNAVLHAWARSGSPQAGDRAEALLRQMPVTPNARSYTTVMDAWSRCDGNALRANKLFEELKSLYETLGHDSLKPNCVSYSTVIHAYASSKEPNKAQRAYELLQEMIALEDPQVLPNTVTYNSVLNACATSSPLTTKSEGNDNEEVCLQNIVQTLYHQLTQTDNKRLQPDHFTFGTVLKACANNIFWDDPAFGMHVFEEACRRGQVSVGVLVQLRQAVPMHLMANYLPPKAYDTRTRQFTMSQIPGSWKRNVRERGSGGR